ncbi:Uncharacterised protein [Burkholderia pseudomallei]|nr:Uncharacterised protein [Burkholderia pseudomallei]
MKSYCWPSVTLPSRSLQRPTSAVRENIEPGVGSAAPLPSAYCDVSSKIAFAPPPRSSVPRSPHRFGTAMPSSKYTLRLPPSFDTYDTPASIRPNSVTLPSDACAPVATARPAAATANFFIVVSVGVVVMRGGARGAAVDLRLGVWSSVRRASFPTAHKH